MGLIRFAIKVALIMMALPALGLVTFTGGLGTGLLAALGIGVLGFFVTLGLLPVLATFGAVGALLAGAAGGRLGLGLFWFAVSTVVSAIAIGAVAWMLPGIALIGLSPTIGAAALLGFVDAVLTPATRSK